MGPLRIMSRHYTAVQQAGSPLKVNCEVILCLISMFDTYVTRNQHNISLGRYHAVLIYKDICILYWYIYYIFTYTYSVFFQHFGTGAGALRIGKISDKTRILGNFSFQ